MWPPIVRNLLLPAHESLLRRPTFAVLGSIAADSDESSADVAGYQSERMAALVAHARKAVPYWRDRESGAGDGSDQSVQPVLTRARIRRHRELMRWPEAPGKLIIHSSSGTTDDNLIFYLDRRRQAWSCALRMRALQRLGIDPGEKQLHFWPQFGSGGPLGSLKDALRAARDRLTNDPAFDLRPLTAARLDEGLAHLDRYRPAVIVGYPSWLFALAEHRLRSSSRRRIAVPRFVLSTGELLYEFQRQAIESAFGARVVEEYGSQDVGLIASEDYAGTWQVNWEHVVVEALRDGRPAQAGETGEVIVTNLHSHVMPFIRYATGDVVTMPADSEPQRTPGMTVLPRIEGRTSDLLVTMEGRTLSNRDVVDMLVRETSITEFSLHQTAADRVLCMTTRERGCVGQEGRVTELLRAMLGQSLHVDWMVGSAFRPLKSGKRRYVCSPVAQALLAHDRESGMFLSRAWPQRVLGAA
jgi:phenylacetate-CoA ligase